MRRIIMLILILLLTISVPIQAKSLVGEGATDASGHTAVTAVVEMEDVVPGQSSNVKTGDNNPTGTYLSLLLISTVVIVANRIRGYRPD